MKSLTLISVCLVLMATLHSGCSNTEKSVDSSIAVKAFDTFRGIINAAWDVWKNPTKKEHTDSVMEWMGTAVCATGINDRLAVCGLPTGKLGYPTDFAKWYPSNRKELGEYCSTINKYGPCLMKWEFLCNGDSKLVLGTVLDACKNNTAFNRGIKKNIECMHTHWKEEWKWRSTCEYNSLSLVGEIFMFQRVQMRDLYPEISRQQSNDIRAMVLMFDGLGCFLSRISCPNAEDAILGIFGRIYGSNILRPEIVEENKNVTIEIIDILPMKDDRKVWTKYAIKKYEENCAKINCGEFDFKLQALYDERATS